MDRTWNFHQIKAQVENEDLGVMEYAKGFSSLSSGLVFHSPVGTYRNRSVLEPIFSISQWACFPR